MENDLSAVMSNMPTFSCCFDIFAFDFIQVHNEIVERKTPWGQINRNTFVIIALLLKTILITKSESESRLNFCKLFKCFSLSRYSSDTQHNGCHKSTCTIETTRIISWLHVLNSFDRVVSRIYCLKTKVWCVSWDKCTSLTEVREIYSQAQPYCA